MEDNKIHIIADEHIPYLKGVLEPFATVDYHKGKDINSSAIVLSDALLVRTRTQCNEQLLKNTPVQFIGSATIGTDHIDIPYCNAHHIKVVNAPGCNSGAVLQYIAACLMYIQNQEQKSWEDLTLGIVGVGNVGKKVHKLAKELGIKILLCDPPRQRKERETQFYDLQTVVKQSDIITFHTPLTIEGIDKTYHMINSDLLDMMKPKAWLINASRGEVADTQALIEKKGKKHYILDVWENEPHINYQLLEMCDIATPHIAGYSVEGKANATKAIVNAIANHFSMKIDDFTPDTGSDNHKVISCNTIQEAIISTYDIMEDYRKLITHPEKMEYFRQTYPYRREFSHYVIKCNHKKTLNTLLNLGFKKLL